MPLLCSQPGQSILWWRSLALSLALLASPVLVLAQAAPSPPLPLPAEAFFRHPEVLTAVLSPDGQRLAITTAARAQRVALVVFDLASGAGASAAKRLVHFRDADITSVAWVTNDRLVFSLADLESGSGEQSGSGLYGVDSNGEDLRLLIERKRGPLVVEGRSLGDRNALNYRHLVLNIPNIRLAGAEIIVGRWDADTRGNLRQITPLWLDTRSGRTRRLGVPVPPGAVNWMFDGRGRPAAVMTQAGGRRTLLWRPPDASEKVEWQALAEGPQMDLPFMPRFVSDDGKLFVEHREGAQGLSVLSPFDFERGRPASEPWVSTPGFDFSGQVLRSDSHGGAVGVRLQTDAETTVWSDPAIQAMQQRADERFPGRVNQVDCRRCEQPDGVALVRSFSARNPGELWLYRASTGRWQGITVMLPGINEADMARVEFHRISARDGRDLPLWLTLPKGAKPGEARPAVVLVHGGPWLRDGYWQWEPMQQFLASRGYLVISPEFRGSTGYGRAHQEAGFKQWGRAMQDDVADALLWAQQQKLTDQRACIAGASYGGYATLMGLVRHPDLYRCGVAWVAVTDLMLLLEGSFWVNDDTGSDSRQYTLPQMIGDVKADAEMLRSVSPVLQAERLRAPLLLAFGEADLRVPLAHGRRMRSALIDAGREPQWVTYPGEGHGGWRPETQADFARRFEAFLALHLLAQPASPAAPLIPVAPAGQAPATSR